MVEDHVLLHPVDQVPEASWISEITDHEPQREGDEVRSQLKLEIED